MYPIYSTVKKKNAKKISAKQKIYKENKRIEKTMIKIKAK